MNGSPSALLLSPLTYPDALAFQALKAECSLTFSFYRVFRFNFVTMSAMCSLVSGWCFDEWRCNGIVYVPTAIKPASKNRCRQAAHLCQFDNKNSLPFVRYESICASVSVLLQSGSPATVSRFVISVVVDAINAVPLAWFLPHVGNKIENTKRTSPPFTNCNAPASIVVKCWVFWVSASANEGVQGNVFWCSVKSVLLLATKSRGLFKASAALCTARNQAVDVNRLYIATVASAVPEILLPVPLLSKRLYDKHSKANSSSVFHNEQEFTAL